MGRRPVKKVMIIDSQGEQITDVYRSLLPGVAMRGVEQKITRGTECHPHGALCGWNAAIPLIGTGLPFEIIFVRIFDKDAKWVDGSEEFILKTIAQERPNYISRSWGAWDGDDAMQNYWASVAFDEFVPEYKRLQAEIGFVDFGAAGNSDNNDADRDVDYPQVQMPEICNIIGACARNGVPTKWSGDGAGVQCVMWGHLVYSPDMTGRWILWSGTSAATPRACGACAALGDDLASWRRRLVNLPESCRPRGDWKLPHPKWGYGCAEDLWQIFARRVPANLLPAPTPAVKLNGKEVEPMPEYFDFKRVADDEARGSDPGDQQQVKPADDEPAGGTGVRRIKTPRASRTN